MNIITKNKPDKPLLIYDGDCGVCILWVEYWKSLSGESVRYAPYQSLLKDFPDITQRDFKKYVHFITPDGQIVRGAGAVFKLFTHCPGKKWYFWIYRHIPGFSFITEAVYRFLASQRDLLYKTTLFLWGINLGPQTYITSRWLFLRLLAVIYFIAFFSFWPQILGLIGSDGISPAEIYLGSLKINFGWKAYFKIPTIAWVNDSDGFIKFIPLTGMLLSLILMTGFLTLPLLILLWFFYLSLVNIGQVFMSFQWDVLLLETGFLAIFLAPLSLFQRVARETSPSKIVIWLYRFLLFRLIFSSGIGKLATGDPTWRDLSALNYHYYTQPLPTPIAWYVHQLPEWFHKFSVGFMLFIEIVVPLFIFAPRRLRFFAGIITILLQVLIILTGNYTFFNLLTIALCLLLFDDAFFQKFIPLRLMSFTPSKKSILKSSTGWGFTKIAALVLAASIILLGAIQVGRVVVGYRNLPEFTRTVIRWITPYRIVNNYGLFTVMTTSRPEIIVEGSDDGHNWEEYGFKYKPVELNKSLPWVAPHQPRLDWQMWFAALGDYQTNPWFINFMYRILEGSHDVLELLDKNPFPDEPPKYLRAMVYEYEFTDLDTRRNTDKIWNRELKGMYLPILTLERD